LPGEMAVGWAVRGRGWCLPMWPRGDGARVRVVTRGAEWHRDGWGSGGVVIAGRGGCGRGAESRWVVAAG
jgi:hypothetical protein